MSGVVVARAARGKGLRGRAARSRKRELAAAHLEALGLRGRSRGGRGRVVPGAVASPPVPGVESVVERRARSAGVPSPAALAARLGRVA